MPKVRSATRPVRGEEPARRLYVCDPVKNTECEKTHCMHNPEAEFWACDMTDRKECAVLDEHGAPMEVDVRKGVSYPVFRSTPELCRAEGREKSQ